MRLAPLVVAMVVGACYPTTTRPAFLPLPAAEVTEIELPVPGATSALAVLLDQDSIPVRRTEPKDGWLETGWFDAQTLRPTGRRPLGSDIVRVRAWIDPSRPNYSNVTVETVYRPVADPSRPGRELEEQVPHNNPVSGRITLVLAQLARAYGGVDTTAHPATDSAKSGRRDTTTIRSPADSATKNPAAAPVKKKLGADSILKKPALDSATKKPATDTVVKKPVADSTRKPQPDTSGTPVPLSAARGLRAPQALPGPQLRPGSRRSRGSR